MVNVLEGFKHFDRTAASRTRDPLVTIQMHGKRIFINEAAYRAMHEPGRIELYYHAERRIVALATAKGITPTSYEPRSDGNGGYHVAGASFTKYMGIDTVVARRYVPEVHRNMLLVLLGGPVAIVTGPRARRDGASGRSTADVDGYVVVVEHVEASYSAYVPDLPDCRATARTFEVELTRADGSSEELVKGRIVKHSRRVPSVRRV